MIAKPARYVSDIDSLRCFAMSSVILFHAGLLPFGWLGVWLFFVISGFAITTSLINDSETTTDRREVISRFYLKRALRILPLYIFYIGVVAVWDSFLNLPHFWHALLYLSTFTYNIAVAFGSPVMYAPGVVQLWSISGEEQFYLAFPILFSFLDRRRFLVLLVAMIVICPPARLLLGGWVGGQSDVAAAAWAVKFFTPVHFDAFAAGALVAILTNRRVVPVRVGHIGLAAGAAILAFYILGYVAWQAVQARHLGLASFSNIVAGHVAGDYREALGYVAFCSASTGLVVAVIARVPFIAMLCRPRIFHMIGRISYGGYVWHGFVTEALTRLWPNIHGGSIAHEMVYFAILYPVTLMFAFASYHLIERPFLKLKPKARAGLPLQPLLAG